MLTHLDLDLCSREKGLDYMRVYQIGPTCIKNNILILSTSCFKMSDSFLSLLLGYNSKIQTISSELTKEGIVWLYKIQFQVVL